MFLFHSITNETNIPILAKYKQLLLPYKGKLRKKLKGQFLVPRPFPVGRRSNSPPPHREMPPQGIWIEVGFVNTYMDSSVTYISGNTHLFMVNEVVIIL